jgi:branched-chain amino acid aminotransferase
MFWLNGVAVSPSEPHLSLLDRGFTLADGVFETMRVYEGVVFRLDAHLERLRCGVRLLEIPLPGGLRDHVAAAAAGSAHASLRLTVSRGPASPGLAAPAIPSPTIALTVNPLARIGRPVHPLVAVMARGRRNEHALTAGVKTLAYTESVIALAQARAAGADEAIFLDTEGHVSEATASNLFTVMDGALVTPPLTCGVLPGITRAAVLALAPTLGLTAIERVIAEPELAAASELFLTSSIREIAPVVRIGETTVGRGSCGPLTERVIGAYAALLRQECRA